MRPGGDQPTISDTTQATGTLPTAAALSAMCLAELFLLSKLVETAIAAKRVSERSAGGGGIIAQPHTMIDVEQSEAGTTVKVTVAARVEPQAAADDALTEAAAAVDGAFEGVRAVLSRIGGGA
jgi:hypothetical protein